MSTPQDQPPGVRGQQTARTVVRVIGCVVLDAALYVLISGFRDSIATDGGPTHFWMMFVGIFGLAIAGWCLRAGFLGAASRYVAGETMSTVKDSASYLTDGQGILGAGRTVDGDARFCDGCGAAVAR
jgi:Na+/proline symporter